MSKLNSTVSGTWKKSGSQIYEALENDKKLATAKQKQKISGAERCDRFFISKPGESKRVVILDKVISGCSFVEHQIYNPNYKREGVPMYTHHLCTKEVEGTCPLCDDGLKPSITLFLTVLEILDEPYVSKSKGITHIAFKKLLAVKWGQIKKFLSLEAIISNPANPLTTSRGLLLKLERESDPKSAGTGIPVSTESGMIYEKSYTEEELIAEFGGPEIRDEEGKVIREENYLIKPFDYDVVIPKLTAAELALVHKTRIPGSVTHTMELREEEDTPSGEADTVSSIFE